MSWLTDAFVAFAILLASVMLVLACVFIGDMLRRDSEE